MFHSIKKCLELLQLYLKDVLNETHFLIRTSNFFIDNYKIPLKFPCQLFWFLVSTYFKLSLCQVVKWNLYGFFLNYYIKSRFFFNSIVTLSVPTKNPFTHTFASILSFTPFQVEWFSPYSWELPWYFHLLFWF